MTESPETTHCLHYLIIKTMENLLLFPTGGRRARFFCIFLFCKARLTLTRFCRMTTRLSEPGTWYNKTAFTLQTQTNIKHKASWMTKSLYVQKYKREKISSDRNILLDYVLILEIFKIMSLC